MGHEIHYMNCNENCNRRQVMDEIQTYSRLHGDGYHSSLTWHDNVNPLDSYEAAKKFIEEHENNKWDDHAVRFYDYSCTEKSTKIKQLEDTIAKLRTDKAAWIHSHSVKGFKAQYIGCSKCGSKLSREHLRGEHCPLCNTDLRSDYVLEKIEWYDHKIDLCFKQIQEEWNKKQSKARIRWLVKFEFHN